MQHQDFVGSADAERAESEFHEHERIEHDRKQHEAAKPSSGWFGIALQFALLPARIGLGIAREMVKLPFSVLRSWREA